MIRLNQLKLPVNHTEEQLVHKTAQSLRIPTEDILELEVVRQSLDEAGTFLQLQYRCHREKRRESIQGCLSQTR